MKDNNKEANLFIHETATVDPGAELGAGTKVWHYAHIETDTKIGEDCSFGQNVYVAKGVTVGDGCRIQNNVSLYTGVELAEGVFCGPSMVFTNVLTPRARFPVGAEAYLSTYVGRDVSIGANATVVCGHDIGEGALIAAGAVVTREVKPFTIMQGVPARTTGFICRCGQILATWPVQRSGSDAWRVHADQLPETLSCESCEREYSRLPEGGLKSSGLSE